MANDYKPFLVRLSPGNVILLQKESMLQERTKASLINEAIKAHLSDDFKQRLNRL